MRAAFFDGPAQKPLHEETSRHRHLKRISMFLVSDAKTHGRKRCRLSAARFQNARNHFHRGGFTVGACHANHRQFPGRESVYEGSGEGNYKMIPAHEKPWSNFSCDGQHARSILPPYEFEGLFYALL